LRSYIGVLKDLKEDQRLIGLRALMNWSKPASGQAIDHVNLLATAVPHFSIERAECLTRLFEFGEHNPKDGTAFIQYVVKSIGQFGVDGRPEVLGAMIGA
jgi:hypothetical protein